MESNNPHFSAALAHLQLLREEHERMLRQETLYVGLAAQSGVSAAQIARSSGIPRARVRKILTGA